MALLRPRPACATRPPFPELWRCPGRPAMRRLGTLAFPNISSTKKLLTKDTQKLPNTHRALQQLGSAPHSPRSLAHTDHGTRAARSNARCNRRRTKREVGECKAAAGGGSVGEGRVSQRRGGWAGWRRTGGSAGQEVHKSQDRGKWTRRGEGQTSKTANGQQVRMAGHAPKITTHAEVRRVQASPPRTHAA